jgi:hypothetical protein
MKIELFIINLIFNKYFSYKQQFYYFEVTLNIYKRVKLNISLINLSNKYKLIYFWINDSLSKA